MSSPFLCGMLCAWAVAQIALGAFFILPYVLRRREAEYLIFALLCLTLAVATSGLAAAYAWGDVEHFERVALLTHLGALPAAALNLHFAMRYAGLASAGRFAAALYALAASDVVLMALGLWWEPGSLRLTEVELFGTIVTHVSATPTLAAWSAYTLVMLELVASMLLLWRAVRAGKREALSAAGAGALVLVVVAHDVLVLSGGLHSVYLLPHAFLLYAFAVASTLVVRYGITAGRLEETATDLQRRTEELRSSHAELEVVQHELSQQQQLAHLGELAAAIAHEVRNPLAVIMNAVSNLRRTGLAGEDHSMLLGIVEEETSRLNRLVVDLLRFARPVQIDGANVSLLELAERARPMLDASIKLEIEVEPDPAAQTVWADAGLLRLVFDNLVANARQAMPEGGTLSIRIGRGEIDAVPAARVEIGDTGHGMEEEVLQRAVDPFYTTRPSGTGLGLPIVERIVTAHGGRIEIESRIGQGTTVTLFLPLGRQSLEPAAPVERGGWSGAAARRA